MTAREYLSRAIYIREQIRQADERIEEIRHRMQSVGAIRYDKLNVQSSPHDPLLENIQKLMDAEQRMLDLEAELVDVYEEIQQKIWKVESDLYRTILIKRYLHDKPLRQIAEEIHYSEDYTCKLHTAALRAFSEVM